MGRVTSLKSYTKYHGGSDGDKQQQSHLSWSKKEKKTWINNKHSRRMTEKTFHTLHAYPHDTGATNKTHAEKDTISFALQKSCLPARAARAPTPAYSIKGDIVVHLAWASLVIAPVAGSLATSSGGLLRVTELARRSATPSSYTPAARASLSTASRAPCPNGKRRTPAETRARYCCSPHFCVS